MPVAVNCFILPSSTCCTCTISHSFNQEFQALGTQIPSSAESRLLWQGLFKSSASCNYSSSNIVLFNWSFAIVKLVSGMGMCRDLWSIRKCCNPTYGINMYVWIQCKLQFIYQYNMPKTEIFCYHCYYSLNLILITQTCHVFSSMHEFDTNRSLQAEYM